MEYEQFQFYKEIGCVCLGLLENCTTWVGPLIVGSVLNATGSMRWGVFSMVSFLFLGLPFIFWVDVKAAREERLAFEKCSRGSGG